MANKNTQNWYQYHKKNAGDKSVENSRAVKNARIIVEQARDQLSKFNGNYVKDTSFFAELFRWWNGPSQQEQELDERLRQLQADLSEAQSKLSSAESNARHSGQSSYAADWAARNPDKCKS